MILPTDYAERKQIPIATGVIDYFPLALAEIARVSQAGNDQHNPGQPLHWARGKSTDQANTMMRHFVERGGIDTDGMRHSAKMAWRALALLQTELELAMGIDRVAEALEAAAEPVEPAESALDVARRQYGFPGEAEGPEHVRVPDWMK